MNRLPEKWAVKVSKESIKALGKWRSAGKLNKDEGYCLYSTEVIKGYWVETLEKWSDYIEISFETFKREVLMEKPVKPKYIIYDS